MFKRKIYLVEWQDIMEGYNSDLIKAKDPADAWKKIKKQWPTYSVSVLKISLYEEVQ
jgi:hypothetical protein